MRRELANVYKKVRGIPICIAYRGESRARQDPTGAIVLIDIKENLYSRYLYSFIKFFDLEGYEVCLKPRLATLYSIKHAQYGNLVLKERLVTLKSTIPLGFSIGDACGDKRLLPYDFRKSVDPVSRAEVYDVPMSQHPMMYSTDAWTAPVGSFENRKRSILFLGNSDPDVYSEIESDGVFEVIDRVTLWNLLKTSQRCVEAFEESALASVGEGIVVLMDSRFSQIPLERFRDTLATFRFFLCAPGAFMPLCHNLIEALSVGSIPVIQKDYAELLEPPLEHGVNAIVFHGMEDFELKIAQCLSMGDEEMHDLSSNSQKYYESNLTPSAVVRRITDPKVKTVRMLAGKHSVRLHRNNLLGGE